MIKAILWDMDGVLIDSETHYVRTEKEFLKSLGVEANDEMLKSYMGVPFSKYFPPLAAEQKSAVTLDEAQKKYHDFVGNLYSVHVELTPHIKDVLIKLSKDYSFALATSTTKKLADVVIERFSLEQYFKIRVHGDEVKNGKPDPEIFSKAAKELNINTDEAIIIEDSANGIKAARAAGIKVIGYKAAHNEHVDFSMADYAITDLRDIPKIIEKVNES